MAVAGIPNGRTPFAMRQPPTALGKALIIIQLVFILLRWGAPPSSLTQRGIARHVRFPWRARQDAIDAARSGITVHPSPTEADAAALLAANIGEMEAWRIRRMRYRRACLEQLDIPVPHQAFAGPLADAQRKLAAARQSFRARVKPLERDAQKSEHRATSCEAVFKPEARPRYAHPLVPIASIILGVLVDAMAAAPFFQKVLPYGYFGGVFVAFFFTAPLIVLAFAAFGLVAPPLFKLGRKS
jgi:hypothetical protein